MYQRNVLYSTPEIPPQPRGSTIRQDDISIFQTVTSFFSNSLAKCDAARIRFPKVCTEPFNTRNDEKRRVLTYIKEEWKRRTHQRKNCEDGQTPLIPQRLKHSIGKQGEYCSQGTSENHNSRQCGRAKMPVSVHSIRNNACEHKLATVVGNISERRIGGTRNSPTFPTQRVHPKQLVLANI